MWNEVLIDSTFWRKDYELSTEFSIAIIDTIDNSLILENEYRAFK